jgi:DNA/RNA-binding domain of Phe-tRNA-synthetase-like protein
MAANTYSIDPKIFDLFPDFFRGVMVAREVENQPSPEELTALLRQEEKDLRRRLADQDIAAHPRIHTWREAFRALGIKPSEYRPSIEALARRVMNGYQLPAINTLVDIGNIISLRYLIPTGGHALDHINEPISLRPATGNEVYVPFGTGQPEHPEPGEIIFAEGDAVLTRRWVWRQSNHTLTELETRFIEFNLDGLPPVSVKEIQQAGEDLAELVQRFCGGTTSLFSLSRFSPTIHF